jgi:predicted ABC-class ATPase
LKGYQDTPYCCNARRTNVLSPVRSTPHHTGMLKSMFNAKAVPITENRKKQSQNDLDSYNMNKINKAKLHRFNTPRISAHLKHFKTSMSQMTKEYTYRNTFTHTSRFRIINKKYTLEVCFHKVCLTLRKY